MSAPVPQSPCIDNPVSDAQPTKRDAQVQTVATQPSAAPTTAVVPEPSPLPMLDLSIDVSNRVPNVSSSSAIAGVKSMTSSVTSATNTTQQAPVDEDHSKDWKKRCARLARMNEDLEKELRKLSEIRLGLEQELKRMQKF